MNDIDVAPTTTAGWVRDVTAAHANRFLRMRYEEDTGRPPFHSLHTEAERDEHFEGFKSWASLRLSLAVDSPNDIRDRLAA